MTCLSTSCTKISFLSAVEEHTKGVIFSINRSHYIQLWEKRCRLLCCVRSRDDNISEAFKNVAGQYLVKVKLGTCNKLKGCRGRPPVGWINRVDEYWRERHQKYR